MTSSTGDITPPTDIPASTSAGNVKDQNVKEVVPFLHVSNMERSLRYYTEGLGFTLKHQWVVEGKVRWCWLTLGGAALMLQEFPKKGHDSSVPQGKVGEGVSLCFTCEDALAIYHEVRSRDIAASEPEVGNAMWVTSLTDPDGFRLFFESATDTPEDTKLSEVK
ncbi:MAG TPA: VOC family protein [Candidatus Acidoferrales bacterium]|jgi:lactoylglutathione lyase|nr:VOC family protein [Candidatus Acidoferrales bacterium]